MQFADVVGHTDLKKHLVDEVLHSKISHAQLFLGKPGFGALPLALAFVQFLFCEDRKENDSCGICPSCRKISACLLYTSPSPRDRTRSRMPSSA